MKVPIKFLISRCISLAHFSIIKPALRKILNLKKKKNKRISISLNYHLVYLL